MIIVDQFTIYCKWRHQVKRILFFAQFAFLLMFSPCQAGFLDELVNEIKAPGAQNDSLDNNTVVKGLKEALATGTERAVKEVAQTDGYFGNELIKILLPGKIQQAASILGEFGYQQQVDELVLSMNRAAEKAAPQAKGLFMDAIKQMTFTDAKKILNGRENEATLYFKDKTSPRLKEVSKPIVHQAMGEVGVTKSYQDLDKSARSVPFAGSFTFDLDQYVTDKALDGLFLMVAEEEKKIRQDPVARTTDLLKKVFGSR